MQQPKPTAPSDAPSGTIGLSDEIGWFSASLSVIGESLDPNLITQLLKRSPTKSWRQSSALNGFSKAKGFRQRNGGWQLSIKPAETDEWNINNLIALLLSELPAESSTWDAICELGQPRIAIGLNLANSQSRDFSIEPDLIKLLAKRNIRLWFDVYAEESDQQKS